MPKSILFSGLVIFGVAAAVVGLRPVLGQSGYKASLLQAEPQAAEAVPSAVEITPEALREQYIKLATERAKAMTEAQLAKAIEVLQRQQDEAAAEAEVHKAFQMLKAVTAKYPETRSAKIAKSGIDSIERARDLPVGTPVPTFGDSPFLNINE